MEQPGLGSSLRPLGPLIPCHQLPSPAHHAREHKPGGAKARRGRNQQHTLAWKEKEDASEKAICKSQHGREAELLLEQPAPASCLPGWPGTSWPGPPRQGKAGHQHPTHCLRAEEDEARKAAGRQEPHQSASQIPGREPVHSSDQKSELPVCAHHKGRTLLPPPTSTAQTQVLSGFPVQGCGLQDRRISLTPNRGQQKPGLSGPGSGNRGMRQARRTQPWPPALAQH